MYRTWCVREIMRRNSKKLLCKLLSKVILYSICLLFFCSNFSNYKARFNMPGDHDSLWYSFNLGPIHFVSFSTEVYYYLSYGLKLLTKQFEWLENDLKQANRPENRAKHPWIITYGHRPMYCSNDKAYDCNPELETFIRQGLPPFKLFGLEQLFYKYAVDVEFFAHEHFYTSLWPMYDFKVHNTSYINATAPIQIVTGSAGNKENREPFSKELPEWNAFHSNASRNVEIGTT